MTPARFAADAGLPPEYVSLIEHEWPLSADHWLHRLAFNLRVLRFCPPQDRDEITSVVFSETWNTRDLPGKEARREVSRVAKAYWRSMVGWTDTENVTAKSTETADAAADDDDDDTETPAEKHERLRLKTSLVDFRGDESAHPTASLELSESVQRVAHLIVWYADAHALDAATIRRLVNQLVELGLDRDDAERELRLLADRRRKRTA